MVLCVTRYNNKTQYENYIYNLNIIQIEDNCEDSVIFKDWNTTKIPHLLNLIDEKRKQRIRSEDKLERYMIYKEIANIRKDIALMRNYEINYYKMKLEDISIPAENKWVYNVPISIHKSICNKKIYVIEMNNDMNEILGIGHIDSRCYYKRCKIYKDNNYNRYSYKGFRIDIKDVRINKYREELEKILFKGSTHQKRGQGIQIISECNLARINSKELNRTMDEIKNNIVVNSNKY
tara:strand:- start:630 stop:1334 length:705 start_codon:yes stop_codon:yes gene_type:complete